MTNRLYQCAVVLHTALVANAPKDTWNLALNGIRIVQDSGDWYVVVGGEVAPYAVFTNEKWEKGINPNEGWIEKTIEQCMPIIKQIMSGAISESEINDWISKNYQTKIVNTYKNHIARKERELANI